MGELAQFTRQLSNGLNAGQPFLRPLKALSSEMMAGQLKDDLTGVIDSIERGSTAYEAFAKYPASFDRTYRNMVRAGEAGGALDVVMTRLANHLERTPFKDELARTFQLFGVLYGSGVGILDTLETVRETSETYRALYDRMRESIRKGGMLAEAFEGETVFRQVFALIDDGEDEGDVDTKFLEAAKLQERLAGY